MQKVLIKASEKAKAKTNRSMKFIKGFLKWTIFAIVIGVVCGFMGTLFHYSVEYVTEYRTANNYIIYFLPLAGLLIVLLYRSSGIEKDEGTNMIISSIRSSEKIPTKMAPLIFVATVITHLFGGSAGREGAALQIGGSISAGIGRFIKLNKNDIHVITMCGMSALFSALFGTPLTATVFSMEVVSVGVMYYTAFLPCLFSSIIAVRFSELLGIEPVTYKFLKEFNLSTSIMINVVILGILCAIVSIIFCLLMHKTSWLAKKLIKNQYIRIFVGGVIVVGLTMLVGNNDYNGAGMNIIYNAMVGRADNFAFLLKILFTAITIGVGFKGGEIVPSFFIGATFGCAVAPLLNINASLGASLGLIAVFCSVVNCPIASIILSVELFGSENIVLFAIVCSVSYMLSGYYSLYSSQKIIYSKLRPHYINIKAH